MPKTNYSSELAKLRKSGAVSPKSSSAKSLNSILKKIREASEDIKSSIPKTASEDGAISSITGDSAVKNTGITIAQNTLTIPESQGISADIPTPKDAYTPKTASGEGARIKSSITNALKPKYGEIGTKGIFDKISDEAVERNISTAVSAVDANLRGGSVTPETLISYPNMQDGLALFYAASESGDKNAAKMAYEAVYLSNDEKSLTQSNNIDEINESDDSSNNDSPNQVEKNIHSYMLAVPKYNVAGNPYYDVIKFCIDNSMGAEDASKIIETSINKEVSLEHAKIMHLSEQWKDVPEYAWTTSDAWKYRNLDESEKEIYRNSKRISFIENYKDVIIDAAEKYDIPPLLVAGVSFIEFGGTPLWFDDVAYTTREVYDVLPKRITEPFKPLIANISDDAYNLIYRDSEKTSFGNTSIQVRRALEMFEYDDNSKNRKSVITSLKNPIQNIYMTACHLDELRNIDFAGKSADELTEDEMKIIASRYNIGPEPAMNAILTEYGDEIYNNKEKILKALGLN